LENRISNIQQNSQFSISNIQQGISNVQVGQPEDRRQRFTAVSAVSGIRNAQEFERPFKGNEE